ncbi:MAG TPA: hypothetical protein VGY56_07000 [Verrucomicrobiae bacterium]|nr:hypothetical protein [Verrucomicrobiae bacterium]
MKIILPLKIVFCFVFFFGFVSMGQDWSSLATKAPWLNYFFSKVSPNTPEFSATGAMAICNPKGVVQFIMPMDLAVSSNCFRWQADAMKIWPMPPQAKTLAKLIHTDTIVFLTKKNERMVYMIYPSVQAYIPIPIPDSALAEFDTRSDTIQIQKTELGQETLLGHPCIKYKAVDTEPNVPPQEGLIWSATDLQGFPIGMVLHSEGALMKFNFQEVQIRNPDSSLFVIPTNYISFTNSADLLNYAREKYQNTQNTISQ